MKVGGVLSKGKIGNKGGDVDRLHTPAGNTANSHQSVRGQNRRGTVGPPICQCTLQTCYHSKQLGGWLLTCRPQPGS
jgi:hypothetical protein